MSLANNSITSQEEAGGRRSRQSAEALTRLHPPLECFCEHSFALSFALTFSLSLSLTLTLIFQLAFTCARSLSQSVSLSLSRQKLLPHLCALCHRRRFRDFYDNNSNNYDSSSSNYNDNYNYNSNRLREPSVQLPCCSCCCCCRGVAILFALPRWLHPDLASAARKAPDMHIIYTCMWPIYISI